MKPLTVFDTITQGMTNWETKPITSYITTLNVDLYLGKSIKFSPASTIYSPDGHVFGPYYDNSDGYHDGAINLVISNTGGIAKGTWYYKVYGYSVTGTQSYSI